MRHPVETSRLCPYTGKRFDLSWSKLDCYDACEHCCHEGFMSVGDRLAKLQKEREQIKE